MDLNTLLPDPQAVRLTLIRPSSYVIKLVLQTISGTSVCPLCQTPSGHIHSRYRRALADLPWHGIAVQLQLHARKFFCKQPTCPRRIFCERLPGVVAAYARRSLRLNQLLELIGFTLGGQAGARLALRLAVQTSPDTLLRRVRLAAKPAPPTPRILGVDDWALRRGNRYGTILVDLERRRVIDLLLDRDARTLAAWLQQHPGVELISRDRASAYAEAGRLAAPQAVQVADRWHLLKNLRATVERVLQCHPSRFSSAAEAVRQAQADSLLPIIESAQLTMLSSHNVREGIERRAQRYARYQEVMCLFSQGVSQRGIARHLQMSRQTIDKYIRADAFPERAPVRRRRSRLDKYLPYLHRRWAEGCDNALQLWREIVEQGYSGKRGMVRRYVWRLRQRLIDLPGKAQRRGGVLQEQFRVPPIRQAAWWLLKEDKDLKANESTFIKELTARSPEVSVIRELAHRFRKMIKERDVGELDRWLEAAMASQLKEVKGFAEGLSKDKDAVKAALEYEWSNGQVEGQVNRLKLIKRQMYGRAKLDLLRARVLHKS